LRPRRRETRGSSRLGPCHDIRVRGLEESNAAAFLIEELPEHRLVLLHGNLDEAHGFDLAASTEAARVGGSNVASRTNWMIVWPIPLAGGTLGPSGR